MTQTTTAMTNADVRERAEQVVRAVESQMDSFMPGKGESSRQCERRRLVDEIADALAEVRLSTPAPVNVDQLREALEGARLLFANGIMVSAAKSAADAEQVATVLDQIAAALASMKGPEAC